MVEVESELVLIEIAPWRYRISIVDDSRSLLLILDGKHRTFEKS